MTLSPDTKKSMPAKTWSAQPFVRNDRKNDKSGAKMFKKVFCQICKKLTRHEGPACRECVPPTR